MAITAAIAVFGLTQLDLFASSRYEYRQANAHKYFYDESSGDLTIFVFASGRYIDRLTGVKVTRYTTDTVVVAVEIRKDLTYTDPTTGDGEELWMEVHLDEPLGQRLVVNTDGSVLRATTRRPDPDQRLTPVNV